MQSRITMQVADDQFRRTSNVKGASDADAAGAHSQLNSGPGSRPQPINISDANTAVNSDEMPPAGRGCPSGKPNSIAHTERPATDADQTEHSVAQAVNSNSPSCGTCICGGPHSPRTYIAASATNSRDQNPASSGIPVRLSKQTQAHPAASGSKCHSPCRSSRNSAGRSRRRKYASTPNNPMSATPSSNSHSHAA